MWTAVAPGWTEKNHPDSSFQERVQRSRAQRITAAPRDLPQTDHTSPEPTHSIVDVPTSLDQPDEPPTELRPRRLRFTTALTSPEHTTMAPPAQAMTPSLPAGLWRTQAGHQSTAGLPLHTAQAMNPIQAAEPENLRADLRSTAEQAEEDDEEAMDDDPEVTVDFF